MSITMEQIKELRDLTGVSMTACKSALEESGGDVEKAVEVLRKKGQAKAADRAERSTGQGAVVVKSHDGKTAMVELLCETDFVARGDDFLDVADKVADMLLDAKINVDDREIDIVKDAVLRLGENVQIGNMVLIPGDNVGDYVHSNRKIGVLVSLKGGSAELAKDLAMHVAATNPQVISPDEISGDLVEKERTIWTEQLAAEGKPQEIVEKIMLGKEKKFREENALLKQSFVKDPDKIVEDLLAGASAEIDSFVRFSI